MSHQVQTFLQDVLDRRMIIQNKKKCSREQMAENSGTREEGGAHDRTEINGSFSDLQTSQNRINGAVSHQADNSGAGSAV